LHNRLWGLALASALLLAYLWLGAAVSWRPPHGIDLAAGGLFGMATPLAAFLTSLGRFPAYAAFCVGVLLAGLVRRRALAASVTAVGLLIVAETTSDWFKAAFHRPRPAHWLVTHETSFSYASGHATNSFVFFGFWAVMALRSGLPQPVRPALAFGLWGISAGIGWSRLALGAHYPTDVLGGYLLGAVVLVLGLTLVPSRFLRPVRPKSPVTSRGKSL
jgi:membrane-associated phospholipid phosphatase